MAYTTINKHTAHFNTALYTGNGGTNAITGVGFQPDKVWIKERNSTNNHEITDAVRGVNYQIYPNLTNAQTNAANHLTTFGTDGFTVGSDGSTNTNSNTYASWNWKANGAGSSNTDGNNITSTVSVNTTAGFSIVKWTGTGSASDTIGHGLGIKPAMVIMRPLGYSGAWWIIHKDLATDNVLEFNANAQANISSFGGGGLKYSTFTTSVIGGGNGSSNSDLWNKSGENYIAYCFAEKTGYSKCASYKGNGNSSGKGAFIYTGFKPSFIMAKRTDNSSNGNWIMWDNKRDGYNPNKALFPNSNSAEQAYATENIDIYSNGWKQKGSAFGNSDGGTFIYYAVGQSLVASNNVPATAR